MNGRLRSIALFLVVFLTLLEAPSALAAQSVAQPPEAAARERALAGFYAKHGRNWVVRWSPGGRRVVSLVGRGTGRDKAAAAPAESFLRENAGLSACGPTWRTCRSWRSGRAPAGATSSSSRCTAACRWRTPGCR